MFIVFAQSLFVCSLFYFWLLIFRKDCYHLTVIIWIDKIWASTICINQNQRIQKITEFLNRRDKQCGLHRLVAICVDFATFTYHFNSLSAILLSYGIWIALEHCDSSFKKLNATNEKREHLFLIISHLTANAQYVGIPYKIAFCILTKCLCMHLKIELQNTKKKHDTKAVSIVPWIWGRKKYNWKLYLVHWTYSV